MKTKFFSDFDGTIYKEDSFGFSISPRDVKTLNDYDFTIVSGKNFQEISQQLENYKVNVKSVICNNGLTIWENKECVFEYTVSHFDLVLTMLDLNWEFIIYKNEDAYFYSPKEKSTNKLISSFKHLKIIDSTQAKELANDCISIGIFAPKEEISKLINSEEFHLLNSYNGYDYFDIMPKGFNKASAIKQILGNDFESTKIVSFGDSMNDFAMAEISDEFYAMHWGDQNLINYAAQPIHNISDAVLGFAKTTTTHHTHTYRCHHANANEELLVLVAIERGYTEIAITEHICHLNDELKDNARPSIELYDEYLNKITYLKNKYKDQIKVVCGFECEYYEEFHDWYQEVRNDERVDLMILSIHEFNNSIRQVPWYHVIKNHQIENYVDYHKKGWATGFFDFIGHPDIFLGTLEWDDEVKKVVTEFLTWVKENNVKIEFNSYGIRSAVRPNNVRKLGHPNFYFWQIANELGIKNVIFGSDTHFIGEFDGWGDELCYKLLQLYFANKWTEENYNETVPYWQLDIRRDF